MTFRAVVAWIILVAAPSIPLTMAWLRALNEGDAESSLTMRARVELGLATFSLALLLCGLIWSPVLGPFYSQRRLGSIYGNLILMVLVAVVSAFGARRLKVPLTASAIVLALEWAYMAAVNSVV
jgi:hypothetical protein